MSATGLDELLRALEAPAPAPAGGTAAAVTAAAAASLVIMVGKGSPAWEGGADAAAAAEGHRERLVTLGDDDARAVAGMLAALRTPGASAERAAALLEAARVPCAIAEHAAAVTRLARTAAREGKRVMAADAAIAALLAEAATRAAALVVTTNLTHFRDSLDPGETAALAATAQHALRLAESDG